MTPVSHFIRAWQRAKKLGLVLYMLFLCGIRKNHIFSICHCNLPKYSIRHNIKLKYFFDHLIIWSHEICLQLPLGRTKPGLYLISNANITVFSFADGKHSFLLSNTVAITFPFHEKGIYSGCCYE